MPSRRARQWQHIAENDKLRKVRKKIKRRGKSKRIRHKDWMPSNVDDLDCPESERVMPRGEQERRQTVMVAALSALREETNDTDDGPGAQEISGRRGIVVEVSTGTCRVNLDGCNLICGVRGSLSARETGFTNVIAVGDEVIISGDGPDDGVVERVLPRRSVLARPDVHYRHLQQVIVANADQLLIVASWREPALWPELLDRYLIAAERNDLTPIICINKVDLAEDLQVCREALRPYLKLGHQVLFTSALTGQGIDELRMRLHERTTVLAGLSGVGKSSLLNAVQPGLKLQASEVSERRHEGRHTTSQVNLLELETGGHVVDTPGIREFGLSDLRRIELGHYYPEIAVAGKDCRFSDCSHVHESSCAVKEAVRLGRVSETRYRNYQKIYDSLPA